MVAGPVLKGNVKLESGYMKQFTHWSDACQCEMTFSIFLPERKQRLDADPPVLYYLSGMFNKLFLHFTKMTSNVSLNCKITAFPKDLAKSVFDFCVE